MGRRGENLRTPGCAGQEGMGTSMGSFSAAPAVLETSTPSFREKQVQPVGSSSRAPSPPAQLSPTTVPRAHLGT